MTIKRFDGPQPGPRFLIFGAMHGNEPCGPTAIERLARELEAGALELARGALILVPIANPAAFTAGRRYIDADLNRVFKETASPRTYEERVANILVPLFAESDYFLDIHSTSAPGPTNVFLDYPTERNLKFARSLPMETALIGWPALYAHNSYGFDSFDTTRYANEHGVSGLIVECGQHEDPAAPEVAYQTIRAALKHLNLVPHEPAVEHALRNIRMTVLEKKLSEEDVFAKDWKHLELVPQNALIATRADGTEIRADRTYIMLLPKHQAQAGQEWYYLGTEE